MRRLCLWKLYAARIAASSGIARPERWKFRCGPGNFRSWRRDLKLFVRLPPADNLPPAMQATAPNPVTARKVPLPADIPARLNAAIIVMQLAAIGVCCVAAARVQSAWSLALLAVGFGVVMNSVYSIIHE